jgi:nucleotide-binding universal stress UspA family protein
MVKTHKKESEKKDYRRIILPIDGSVNSKRAAKKAIAIAKETGIEITALYVLHEPTNIYPEFESLYPDAVVLMKKDGKAILDDIKKIAAKEGVTMKTKLTIGLPDQEIIKEAGKNDLIIMGCKGHSTFNRILMGSVCEKVLHHSTSSVMVIK